MARLFSSLSDMDRSSKDFLTDDGIPVSYNLNASNLFNAVQAQLDKGEPLLTVNDPILEPYARMLSHSTIGNLVNEFNGKIAAATQVSEEVLKRFENIYELVLRCRKYKLAPGWAKRYNINFMVDRHLVSISAKKMVARSMAMAEDIMLIPRDFAALQRGRKRFFELLTLMMLMFNEGLATSTRPVKLVKSLYQLRLLDQNLYYLLLFLARMQESDNDKLGDLVGPNGTFQDEHARYLYLLLVLDVYVRILHIYVPLQKPFLLKFYNLVQTHTLGSNYSPEEFYTFY